MSGSDNYPPMEVTGGGFCLSKKIIGLFGDGQYDLCIYLACMLENLGLNVCVSDNSCEKSVFNCISKPDIPLDTVTFKNVDFTCDMAEGDLLNAPYDAVIVNSGSLDEVRDIKSFDERILIVKPTILNILNAKEFLMKNALPTTVVIRDMCENAPLTMKLFETLENENCFVLDKYFLDYSDEDKTLELSMYFDGYTNFYGVSMQMERLILSLARVICTDEKKLPVSLIKALHRAERGECL